MALGADINSQLAALGGLGFNNLAASASDGAYFVVRMDSVFHFHVPLFKNLMFFDIGRAASSTANTVIIPQFFKIARVFSIFFDFFEKAEKCNDFDRERSAILDNREDVW